MDPRGRIPMLALFHAARNYRRSVPFAAAIADMPTPYCAVLAFS